MTSYVAHGDAVNESHFPCRVFRWWRDLTSFEQQAAAILRSRNCPMTFKSCDVSWWLFSIATIRRAWQAYDGNEKKSLNPQTDEASSLILRKATRWNFVFLVNACVEFLSFLKPLRVDSFLVSLSPLLRSLFFAPSLPYFNQSPLLFRRVERLLSVFVCVSLPCALGEDSGSILLAALPLFY